MMAAAIPPRPEDLDRWHRHTTLENFGRTLNKRAKLVYSSETRSRYLNVYVLIIEWEKEDPNLPVSHEIKDLCQVFEGIYYYQTEVYEIPDKRSHARVSKKINAFIDINDDSKDDLKIVYYAGHGRLSKTKDLVWSSLRNKDTEQCSTVTWTGIQKSLEQAESDVLILLDCCSGGLSNVGEGNGVTVVMSACTYDAEANGVGHYSFTKALIIELGLLSSKQSFSTGELHQNVYSRTQHHLAQGIANERYPAPVHLELTRDRGFLRSIQLSVHQTFQISNRRVSNPLPLSCLEQDWTGTAQQQRGVRNNGGRRQSIELSNPSFHGSSSHDSLDTGTSASMSSFMGDFWDEPSSLSNSGNDISSSQSSLESDPTDLPWPNDVPRLVVAIRLEDHIKPESLSSDDFADWLRTLPAPVKEVRVEAGFASDPSVVLLSLPLSLRPYLPHNLGSDQARLKSSMNGSRAATPVPCADSPAVLDLPAAFQNSNLNFQSYPTNLLVQRSSSTALESQRKRLELFAPMALSNGPSHVEFHDFSGNGSSRSFEKGVIIDDSALKVWLGNIASDGTITKRDPSCRFILINGNVFSNQLPITRTMLARILTYHQVMPTYVDCLSIFGSRVTDKLTFISFLHQTSLAIPPHVAVLSGLGRSGRQYQLCYNLKTIRRNASVARQSTSQEWAISQAVFHHQFDVEEGTSLWIVAHENSSIKERLGDMTSVDSNAKDRALNALEDSFQRSLSTHLFLCQMSIEGWPSYLNELKDLILKDTKPHAYDSIISDGTTTYRFYSDHDLRILKGHGEKLKQATTILEANIGVISCLRAYYSDLMEDKRAEFTPNCQDDFNAFASQVEGLLFELKILSARTHHLVSMNSDRQDLILQHLQSQATSKMEDLTVLVTKLARDTKKEQITVKIITVMTLIYLPATFVSTFFGMNIFTYDGHDIDEYSPGGFFSSRVMYRWLFISVPLTALTMLVWWFAYARASRTSNRRPIIRGLPLYRDVEQSAGRNREDEKKWL